MTPPRKVSPGRGWRLLRKGEVIRKGDECLAMTGVWRRAVFPHMKVGEGLLTNCVYRRAAKNQ